MAKPCSFALIAGVALAVMAPEAAAGPVKDLIASWTPAAGIQSATEWLPYSNCLQFIDALAEAAGATPSMLSSENMTTGRFA